ncbi:hypothetical protein H1R20_g13172, partial [Candolleomyces eurysporus]
MTLNGAPVTTFLEAARNFVEHVWQQILSNFYPVEDVPVPPCLPIPLPSESLRVSFALPNAFLGEIELDFVRLVFILLVVLLVVVLSLSAILRSLSAIRRSRARLSESPELPPATLGYDLAGVVIRAVGTGPLADDVYLAVLQQLQEHRKLIKMSEVDGNEPILNLSTELGPEHDPFSA